MATIIAIASASYRIEKHPNPENRKTNRPNIGKIGENMRKKELETEIFLWKCGTLKDCGEDFMPGWYVKSIIPSSDEISTKKSFEFSFEICHLTFDLNLFWI